MATLDVAITKAGGRKMTVDLDSLPEDMYLLALAEGLKVILNAKMSSIQTAKKEGDELAEAQAKAWAKAEENLSALKAGEIKKGRATKTSADGKKISGAVLVEARRLAREVVKNELRAHGIKISHVPASDITKAANEFIEADPSYIAQATANIEERSKIKATIDITTLVSESPKLIARAKEEAEARKSILSAAKASKAAPRKAKAVAVDH